MPALEEIAAERKRQIEGEGWTPEHDDQHGNGQLARAAAFYAGYGTAFTYTDGPAYSILNACDTLWPWDIFGKRPKDTRRNLVRAGALIVAEIERLDRAAERR